MKSRRVIAMSLAELLIAMSLFSIISTITFILYKDGRGIMTRSANRMDGRQRTRFALERLAPIVSSAYVPPITSVSTFYGAPIANAAGSPSFAPGTNATSFASSSGMGTDSMIFFAPGDLVNTAVPLTPVVNWTFGTYSSEAGPKMYEIRLDWIYARDTYADYQVDQTAKGRGPLILRPLMLRELYMPADINSATPTIRYLIPPSSASGSPQPSVKPVATTPTRCLARNLSDARFKLAPGGGGVVVSIYAQDRENTTEARFGEPIVTSTLTTVLYSLQNK